MQSRLALSNTIRKKHDGLVLITHFTWIIINYNGAF